MKRDYFEGADVAVTICAKDGTILDMNAKSKKTFLKPGMPEIIGQNVLDCHPPPGRHAGEPAHECLHRRERRRQEADLPNALVRW